MLEITGENEAVTFIAARRDLRRAEEFAIALDLSMEEYLRRALRIVNAETEAYLSKYQK
jgi:hypothetical protein